MKWRSGILGITLVLLLAMAMVSPLLAVSADAETVPQMRLRLFADAQARQPDIWNKCDAVCIEARVASAPFLVGLAKQANVAIADLARYSVVRSYEWGLNFENTKAANTDCRAKSTPTDNKCAPTIYDWTYGYADNAEALRYELAASPVVFAVNEWATKHYYRLKMEYGGPY
jgi:hypothetical protein